MSFKKFEDTTIPAKFVLGLTEQSGAITTTEESYVPIITQVILMGMTDFAYFLKQKEKPIAVVIDDLKGNIILGLKVEFLEGTDDNPEGSWNPVWSFDADDFKDCDIFKVSESTSFSFITNRAKVYHMTFHIPQAVYTSALIMANAIVSWLDENAADKDTVGVEMDSIFKASVSIIDGKKVMTFSADEELTNIIKDDAALQTK